MSDYRLNLLFWAAGLIFCGLLLLLFNFSLLVRYEPIPQYIVAGIFGAGAIAFFGAYLAKRQNWWRLIPGWTMAALAAMMVVSTQPAVDRRLVAALLFVGLAIAFSHIYLLKLAEHWWAIIPGGFMFVLSAVIALSAYIERLATLGTVLFVGLGLVFFLLYWLGGRSRQWWALIPGSVLVLFGLFIFTVDSPVQNALLRWWPLLLVGLGIFFGWRATRRPAPEKLTVNSAPYLSNKTARTARQSSTSGSAPSASQSRSGALGEYSQPAPGTSIDILPDPDEK